MKRWIQIFFGFALPLLAGEETHFLSFIMPCYNCEKTVEESIESIFRQNLKVPFELICTDDGSIDHTYELLLKIKEEHPEMKVLQHRENQGGGPARNTCVKNSQGDLIFCLDSDNLLANPNDIQDLIDFLDEEKVDAACFAILQFFEGNLKLTNSWEFSAPEGRYTASDIVKTCNHPCASGNYLFTRKSFDAVGGYSHLYVLDTFYFGLEQACHGFPIAYLKDHCYLHRVSPNGYYARGKKADVLDREFIDILLRHPELFTFRSLNFLTKAKKEGKFPNGWDYVHVTVAGLLQTQKESLRK